MKEKHKLIIKSSDNNFINIGRFKVYTIMKNK